MRVTSKELRRRIRRILSEGPSPADDTTFSHNKLQDMFVSTGELKPLEMRYQTSVPPVKGVSYQNLKEATADLLKNLFTPSAETPAKVRDDITSASGPMQPPPGPQKVEIASSSTILYTMKASPAADADRERARMVQDAADSDGNFEEQLYSQVIIPNHTDIAGKCVQMNDEIPNFPGVDVYAGDLDADKGSGSTFAAAAEAYTPPTAPGVAASPPKLDLNGTFFSIKSSTQLSGGIMKAKVSGACQAIEYIVTSQQPSGNAVDWINSMSSYAKKGVEINLKYGIGFGVVVYKRIGDESLSLAQPRSGYQSSTADLSFRDNAQKYLDTPIFSFQISKAGQLQIARTALRGCQKNTGATISTYNTNSTNLLKHSDFETQTPALEAELKDNIAEKIFNDCINKGRPLEIIKIFKIVENKFPASDSGFTDQQISDINHIETTSIGNKRDFQSSNPPGYANQAAAGVGYSSLSHALNTYLSNNKENVKTHIYNSIINNFSNYITVGQSQVGDPMRLVIDNSAIPAAKQTAYAEEILGVDINMPVLLSCLLYSPDSHNVKLTYDGSAWKVTVGAGPNAHTSLLTSAWSKQFKGGANDEGPHTVAQNLGGTIEEVAAVQLSNVRNDAGLIDDITSSVNRKKYMTDEFKSILIKSVSKNQNALLVKLKPVIPISRQSGKFAADLTSASTVPSELGGNQTQTLGQYISIVQVEREFLTEKIKNIEAYGSGALNALNKVDLFNTFVKEIAIEQIGLLETYESRLVDKIFTSGRTTVQPASDAFKPLIQTSTGGYYKVPGGRGRSRKSKRGEGQFRDMQKHVKDTQLKIALGTATLNPAYNAMLMIAVDVLADNILKVHNTIKDPDADKKQAMLRTYAAAVRGILSTTLSQEYFDLFVNKLTKANLFTEVLYLLKTLITEMIAQSEETQSSQASIDANLTQDPLRELTNKFFALAVVVALMEDLVSFVKENIPEARSSIIDGKIYYSRVLAPIIEENFSKL